MPLYSMCYIRTAQYLRLVLLYILTRSAPARRNMLPLPNPEKCNALPWDIRPHRRPRPGSWTDLRVPTGALERT